MNKSLCLLLVVLFLVSFTLQKKNEMDDAIICMNLKQLKTLMIKKARKFTEKQGTRTLSAHSEWFMDNKFWSDVGKWFEEQKRIQEEQKKRAAEEEKKKQEAEKLRELKREFPDKYMSRCERDCLPKCESACEKKINDEFLKAQEQKNQRSSGRQRPDKSTSYVKEKPIWQKVTECKRPCLEQCEVKCVGKAL